MTGMVEFFDGMGDEDGDDAAEMRVDGRGVVITGTYQISSGMRVTIGANDHLLKELALLKQLSEQTEALVAQHSAQLKRYEARIASIERGDGIIDLAFNEDGSEGGTRADGGRGAERGGGGGGSAGWGSWGERGAPGEGWFLRDIESKDGEGEGAGGAEGASNGNGTGANPTAPNPAGSPPSAGGPEAGEGEEGEIAEEGPYGSSPIIELTEAPHELNPRATATSVRTLVAPESAGNCSQMHAEAYAVTEFSAFAIDFERKELLRFEHHVHPDVRAIHVTSSGGGLLFDGLTKSLEGMCAGERREIIIPPHRGFGHAQFDKHPASDFPVGRDRVIMIRINLLQFSSLDDHVRKIQNLEGMIGGLKSQVESVARLQSEYEGKQRQKSDAERRAEAKLRELAREKKHYEDRLNYGVLLAGIYVVIFRYRQTRDENRAKRLQALSREMSRR